MELLSEKLKNYNLKVTPQRLAIYNYLLENKNHPNAETIYNDIKKPSEISFRRLKKQYPTMSLATVYKTLLSLKKVSLINELNIGEDSFRYDIVTNFHYHIICSKCNKIVDYYPEANEITKLKTKIQEDTEFSLTNEQIYFYGVCKDCK